jgi:hypothetical protein
VQKFLVIDLDGTLCDCSHRVHWAQAKQWEEFDAGIPEDQVNETVRWLCLQALECDTGVILCTGRDERNRAATLKWLHANGCAEFSDTLLMRPKDDWSPDDQLKPNLLFEHFGSQERALEQVLCILDDRDKVVEAWRNLGFKCWQVQAGSY